MLFLLQTWKEIFFAKIIIAGKEYLQIYRIENRYLHYASVRRHTFCTGFYGLIQVLGVYNPPPPFSPIFCKIDDHSCK
jgi:hypothetical protein